MQAAAIIAVIQSVLASAPQIEKAVIVLKEFITGLFSSGLISKDKQDALHSYVDSCMNLALTGQIPDHWKVDPDPE